MRTSANDTLLHDEPVVRGRVHPPVPEPDRTADFARIVRRALRNPTSDTPLSRAIRAAAARANPPVPVTASQDEFLRIRQVAQRMGALLAERVAATPLCAPHL